MSSIFNAEQINKRKVDDVMWEVGRNVKQNFIHIKKICLFSNTFLFVILSRAALLVLHCERSFMYSLCG
jgi:hypothetical protein